MICSKLLSTDSSLSLQAHVKNCVYHTHPYTCLHRQTAVPGQFGNSPVMATSQHREESTYFCFKNQKCKPDGFCGGGNFGALSTKKSPDLTTCLSWL